jgi:hypothetical protein
MRPSSIVLVLVLGVTAVLISGCTGSDGGRTGAAPTASGTSAPIAGTTSGAATSRPPSAVTTAPAGSGAEPSKSGTACATQAWGTGPKDGSPVMSAAPLYLVRAGQHPCYDRVVFDVNGPEAVGYTARYVPVVHADGSGKPVPVAGGAALEVVVRAPMLSTDSQGHQPGSTVPAVGENLVAPSRLAGWSSLRQVAYAGSFEGQTTTAIGVRARLPFRVFVTGDRGYRHIVVDIAR